MTPDPSRHTGRIDGRRLRGERTRQLMIEACLALVRRHRRMPTGAEVAAAAGYAIRSLFQRFADLDSLVVAAADYAIAQGQMEAMPRDLVADRAGRIRAHVQRQSETCERWLPLWQVLIAGQDSIPDLRARVATARLGNVERIRLVYRPELEVLPRAERDRLAVMLSALTSFESWDQLRGTFGLSVEQAQRAWRDTIDRLLPASATGSDD